MKKIILIVVLVIVGIGALYLWREYNRTVEGLADTNADYSVNATQLISEFENNETAANKKYQNKIVAVKGMFKKLEGNGGTGIVVLGDTNALSAVRCVLDSTVTGITALQPGSAITIKGAITGFNKDETGLLGSDVQLNRCIISK